MTKSTKKQLVLQVANAMCNVNNKLSTKELKIELRNQYPDEQWNKYDNGAGVSDLFHELVREGKFVSVGDNGTYQTYASVLFPIKDRKGAPYISDLEENAISASVGLANALNKIAVKKTGTVKASPTTVATVTKNKANVINRTKALELMSNNKGRFFTAIFTDKKNQDRTINCRYLKDQSVSKLGYVKVTDEALRKVNPNDCIRNVNLQTLKSLSIGGTQYKIK